MGWARGRREQPEGQARYTSGSAVLLSSVLAGTSWADLLEPLRTNHDAQARPLLPRRTKPVPKLTAGDLELYQCLAGLRPSPTSGVGGWAPVAGHSGERAPRAWTAWWRLGGLVQGPRHRDRSL
jgi:hypothetical protein